MPLDSRAVSLQTTTQRVAIAIRRERFAEYAYAPAQVPGFNHLYGIGERAIALPHPDTRRVCWFAHGSVNGVRIAAPKGGTARPGEEETASNTSPVGLMEAEETTVRRGPYSVGFQQTCAWLGADNRALLTDTRTMRALPGSGENRILDIAITLQALPDKPVTLEPSQDSLLMLNVARALVAPQTAQVRNSQGDYGLEKLHGRRAGWVSCVGVVDGVTIGFALLDHPDNATYPTPWSARPDGLLAVSPFGWQKERLDAGRKLRFRYRLFIHEGYVGPGWADERLREFAREPDRD